MLIYSLFVNDLCQDQILEKVHCK